MTILAFVWTTLVAQPSDEMERAFLRQAAAHVKYIIAHRGSSADRPEGTLAAYRRAIEVGATVVEIDVRSTKDGQLVCLHDATVDRTTNGRGKVADFTLAEIKMLDAGSWFDLDYKQERIPMMREVLALCRGKCLVLLDLKETGSDYDRRVAAEVKRFSAPENVIVGVRSVEQARTFRRLLPKAKQLGLIPRPEGIDDFASAGVETIRLWPHWLKDQSLAEKVRRQNCMLHLNGSTGKRDEVVRLLRFRPDSLSSDNPAQLIETLKQLKD